MSKFYIDQEGKRYTATILTNFELYGDHYCVYTIPDEKTKKENVYVAKIKENQLYRIESVKERELAGKVVKQLFHDL